MWRKRLPDLSEEEKFVVRMSIGNKSLFLKRRGEGLQAGPRSGNDHITIVSSGDEGDLVEVHRKVKGKEDWRHTQDSILGELRNFWKTHSEEMKPNVFLQPQTYLLSVHRLHLLYEIFTNFLGVLFALFGWFFATLTIIQMDERNTLISLDVKTNRILHFMSGFRLPFLIFSRILTRLTPNVYSIAGKVLSKVLLLNPRNPRDLKDDIGILLSKDRVGVVLSNDEAQLSYLSLSSLLELYNRIETRLPFGKLDKIFDGSPLMLTAKVHIARPRPSAHDPAAKRSQVVSIHA